MTKTYVNAAGAPISRQRADQLRHPDRQRARAAVFDAVVTGKLPRPTTLPCIDCGAPAREYDHFLGYEPVHRLDVQAVCRRCHYDRGQLRMGTCRRGHPYTIETTWVSKRGHRTCVECTRERSDLRGIIHVRHEPRSGGTRSTSIYLYSDDDDRIDELIANGYGPGRSEVIRRALREAASQALRIAAVSA